MPVSVPNSPKVLTTKYQNWRGVDYTNDPSNVWYRRSPNGLNMLPNLDGQPFKRNGWKVELSTDDFVEAKYAAYDEYDSSKDYFVGDICKLIVSADERYLCRCTQNALHEAWNSSKWGVQYNVAGCKQYKVDYFEIGGTEYLWFYTSQGCYLYGNSLVYIGESYQIGDDEPYDYSIGIAYAVGDYCRHESDGEIKSYRCKTKIETPEAWDSSKWLEVDDDDCHSTFPRSGASVDYSKSFFFEGGGRAGYYLFVDDKMFWFDGDKLHEAKPTIPVVLTMADATGAGTLLEEVNMLTPWRAVDYLCDGTTAAYKIADGAESVLNVYTIEEDGSFTPNYDWVLQSGGILNFGEDPPQETRPNQPSMRVVYKTANATFSEETATSSIYEIKIQRNVTTLQKQKYASGKWTNYGSPTKSTKYTCVSSATIPLANPQIPLSIQVDSRAGAFMTIQDEWNENVSDVTVTPNAYGDTVTLTGGTTLFNRYSDSVNPSTTTTSYINASSTSRTKKTVVTTILRVSVKIKYTQWVASYGESGNGRSAFFATSKSLVYGNGIINQVFLTASKFDAYSTRVWYSAATDPLYFPDTNYIEVGATDKHIMGLIKVDDYLGIIKQGSATDTSVYLAYATSFEDITTYAVKQSVNGVGAISNGAFNILNGEPLFLSAEGVMGIEPAEDEARKIRNRSYYINKKLLAEPSLESAFSFVYGGMYWLCVNNHCYVLDGSQKVSWENTKTNLQYECYYLENIPAICFARKDGYLWFTDKMGNVCRFKGDNEELRYVDDYTDFGDFNVDISQTQKYDINLLIEDPTDMRIAKNLISNPCAYVTEPNEWTDSLRDTLYEDGITYTVEQLREYDKDANWLTAITYIVKVDGEQYVNTWGALTETGVDTTITVPPEESFFDNIPDVQESAEYSVSFLYAAQSGKVGEVVVNGQLDTCYTIKEFDGDYAVLLDGVPIPATWGTIADDDGSANYYKKLQKRGSLVAVMPMSDSGVKVYLIPDEKEPIFVGETDIGNHILPFNYYLRKKVKNYKRLQIVCENASYNDGFGIDEIIKCYTVGNYAKR